ncbi:MAG: homoserine O-acetyltransferase [Gammaproteobacteria bacterium]|nr:homoserine O-acetyltransferase [Gammaproteobacteria bacterium]
MATADTNLNEGALRHAELGLLRPEAPAPLWANQGRPLVDALPISLAYRSWGRLNADGDNAVLVLHALTGNTEADQWWSGLFGPGRLLDPEHWFIVCPNLLGSCYGSTGPGEIAPDGRLWGERFPRLGPGDQVTALERLREHLGVARWQRCLGGSLGGFVALEYVYQAPARCADVLVLATAHKINALASGYNHLQRSLITGDAEFPAREYDGAPELKGLAQARMHAMLTYRSFGLFEARYGKDREGKAELASYLDYQGEKLVQRFEPAAYIALTQCMDAHDLERHGVPLVQTLRDFAIEGGRLAIVSYAQDQLFPAWQQRELAEAAGRAGLPVRLFDYNSAFGHDAFLADTEVLDRDLRHSLAQNWTHTFWTSSHGTAPQRRQSCAPWSE